MVGWAAPRTGNSRGPDSCWLTDPAAQRLGFAARSPMESKRPKRSPAEILTLVREARVVTHSASTGGFRPQSSERSIICTHILIQLKYTFTECPLPSGCYFLFCPISFKKNWIHTVGRNPQFKNRLEFLGPSCLLMAASLQIHAQSICP